MNDSVAGHKIQVSIEARKSYLKTQEKSVRLKSSAEQGLRIIHNRLVFAVVIFFLAFSAVTARLIKVTIFSGEVAGISREEQITGIQFERGNIVDRNGVLLASNLSTASLYANPKQVIDAKDAATLLSQTLSGVNYKDLAAKLESKKNFVWIKRNLTPKDQYAVNSLGLPGLYFKKEEKRIYPHDNLASHILGYVGVDGHGLAGVEKQFDKLMLSETSQDEPLQLSLDVRVQEAIREEVAASIREFKAIGGTGMVMDVNTGEILGMVSLPDFNPNDMYSVKPETMFNRNTLGTYEMGSIFKALTIAMALDSGASRISDVYDATNPIRIANFVINDFHPKARPLNVAEIFMYSSNIGTAKIALDAGIKEQQNFMKKMGLLDEMEIELPEKGNSLFPKIWKKISAMTIAYGHGISVTPLHIATATAALVNGGYLYNPTLIKKSSDELLHLEGKKVIKQSTSETIRKLLRLVVEHGTGSKADVKGYLVGGKTGSAEKISSSGYNKKANLSSFIGAFPINDPKYLVFVMLDEPVGNESTGGYATGGQTAAPTAARIVSKIASVLNVVPVDENSPVVKAQLHINYERKEKRVATN